jgi:hypothetical protein
VLSVDKTQDEVPSVALLDLDTLLPENVGMICADCSYGIDGAA